MEAVYSALCHLTQRTTVYVQATSKRGVGDALIRTPLRKDTHLGILVCLDDRTQERVERRKVDTT